MGTSGGEPKTLLNALKPMLGCAGDIKTSQEVVRIVSLMRDAEKLMSRCVYINILKATIFMAKENKKSNETLEKFVSIGGWNILNKWLSDAKKCDNFSIVIELLQILKDLPVSVDTLKQGNTGKIVKYLTKVDDQEVKDLSSSILKQWMLLVRNQSGTTGPEKPKQNGESMETGSQSSDSSLDAVVKDSHNSNSDAKSIKRLREVLQGETKKKTQPEKKVKRSNEEKALTIKKEIKVIAIESTGFMNALATAAAPVPMRKRKRPTTTAEKASTTASTTTTISSSTSTKPTYTGILDDIMIKQSQTHGLEGKEKQPKSKEKENGCALEKSSPNGSPESGTPASGDAGDFIKKEPEASEKENSQESSTAASTPSTTTEDLSESAEPYVRKPNKKGRIVTWAEDNSLATYHFFEMDEDERALIRHPVNFINAAHLEMMRERELLEKAKRLTEDKMTEKVKWYKPRVIIGLAHTIDYGARSEQNSLQKERESSVLADIYFSKSSVPDSPAEPDQEHDKVTGEPRVIPHDEKGTTHLPLKMPTPAQGEVQLPAPLASLFSSAGPTPPPPQSDPVSVQFLLDKIMSGGSVGQPNPLMKLLSNVQQQPPQETGGTLPPALKNILEPLQSRTGGPRPPGPVGLLGFGPGDTGGLVNVMGPPGQFGPRGPQPLRPDQPHLFQGPGGPRHGPPMGPLFPGPEVLGPRLRGPMPRMPPPRPLLPELANRDDYQDDMFDQSESGEDEDNNASHMRGRGRGSPRSRGRGRGRGRGMAPVCRHFVSKRGCLRGESCHFLHPGVNGPPI